MEFLSLFFWKSFVSASYCEPCETCFARSINLPGLHTRSARKLRIEVDPPAMFQGDGELLGSSPVEIEIVPRAMRFLAPRAAAR